MVKKTRIIALTALFSFSVVLSADAGKQKDCKDTLGRFVPDDVWVFESGWHDPQRDFLVDHLCRVWDSVKKSGVFDEFKSLIESDMSADQKTEFNDFWDQAVRLCGAVQWGDLISKETVFASRFSNVVPEFFFLFDAEPDSIDNNVTAMAEIFKTLADTADEITLAQDTYQSADVWEMSISGAPIAFYLTKKDNTIGLFMGKTAMQDCLDLMAGESKKSPIVASQRFQGALTRVAAPTFSVSFIDFSGLFAFLNRVPDMITAHHHAGDENSEAARWKKVMSAIIDQLDMLEYVIVTGTMDGTKEYYHNFAKLKDGGEKKALHRMCADQRMFNNFEKFIPKSSKGFAVSAGFNMNVLYDAIEQFARTNIPDGDAHWAEWENIQTEHGFSVREDLLSWISGEFVSVTIPSIIQTPFGSSDQGVMMIGVSDAKKAAAQLDRLINWADEMLSSHNQKLLISDATKVPAEGFRNVTHPMIMMMVRPCVGVWNDWLVIGTSQECIADMIKTHSGEGENIKSNSRFAAEGLAASGPVYSASFTDLNNLSAELAQVSVMMGMFGAMIPNEPETKPVRMMMNIIGRLGPTFMEINFLSSASNVTTLEKDGWASTYLTVYKTNDEIQAASKTN